MTDNAPPPPPPVPPTMTTSSSKGLISRIFDLSFSEFITPSIIKIIFVVGIILSGLTALVVFASLASQGGAGVVIGLILAPILFFIYVLIARVVSELYLLLFKIEQNTRPR